MFIVSDFLNWVGNLPTVISGVLKVIANGWIGLIY